MTAIGIINVPALKAMVDGDIDWLNDSFKAGLANGNPDYVNVKYRSSMSESSGTGYTSGGVALSNTGTTTSAGFGTLSFTCDSFAFSNVSVEAKFIFIYKDTGNAATDQVVGFIQLPGAGGGSFIMTNETITVNPGSTGVMAVRFANYS